MSDPFDTLRLPATPLAPRAQFAADLRRRMLTAIEHNRTNEEETMISTVTVRRVEVYLSVDDPRAIDFYQRAFGAHLLSEPIVMPDGTIGHAELAIGDSVIRVAGEHRREGVRNPASLGGTTVQLYVTVDDPDALVARAVAAGAEVLRPMTDDHGTRIGKLRDPFGHNWFVARS